MENLILFPVPLDELKKIIYESVKDAIGNLPLQPIEPKQQNVDDELLTVKDLCKLFGKTKATIHTWKREGIIPFHRISGRVYFKRQEVLESLKKVQIEKR